MRKIFYEPIRIGEMGRRTSKFHTFVAEVKIHDPSCPVKDIEVSVRGKTSLEATEKLMSFLDNEHTDAIAIDPSEGEVLQLGIRDRLVDFYMYKGWYVQHGGHIVNHTLSRVTSGMDSDDIQDDNCFTADEPIFSMIELIINVEK